MVQGGLWKEFERDLGTGLGTDSVTGLGTFGRLGRHTRGDGLRLFVDKLGLSFQKPALLPQHIYSQLSSAITKRQSM